MPHETLGISSHHHRATWHHDLLADRRNWNVGCVQFGLLCHTHTGIGRSQGRRLNIMDISQNLPQIVAPLTRDREGKLEMWGAVHKVTHIKCGEKEDGRYTSGRIQQTVGTWVVWGFGNLVTESRDNGK